MIKLYYHQELKLGIITDGGMPAVVITDEKVMEFEQFIETAKKVVRQTGKSDGVCTQLDMILRFPDKSIGWQEL
jgi:hypothetical protein